MELCSLMSQPYPPLLLLCNSHNMEGRGWRARLGALYVAETFSSSQCRTSTCMRVSQRGAMNAYIQQHASCIDNDTLHNTVYPVQQKKDLVPTTGWRQGGL